MITGVALVVVFFVGGGGVLVVVVPANQNIFCRAIDCWMVS